MKRTAAAALCLLTLGCGGSKSSSSSSSPSIPPPTAVGRVVLATGMAQPMQYLASPSDSRLAYVLERAGRVRVFVDDALAPGIMLDLTSEVFTEGECGLSGMAFAPDFATSRAFYLHYNTMEGGTIRTRVTRFTMSADGLTASPSGTPVFTCDQPYNNHKGGTIRFGGDGLLYLALGDGGGGNDPGNRAQDPASLLGKVLRIDPTGDDFPDDANNAYRIPASNPFAKTAGVRGEIWAFGMRNPFRWSVDSKTKALIFADVGQDGYEEIDYQPAGAGGRNYGWRVREGSHATNNAGPTYPIALTDPFLEYDHTVGASITGGYVVRTSTLGLKDRYLFADFISRRLWSVEIGLQKGEARPTSLASAVEIGQALDWRGVVSIDPDRNGEPVVTELNVGAVSRLVPLSTAPTN